MVISIREAERQLEQARIKKEAEDRKKLNELYERAEAAKAEHEAMLNKMGRETITIDLNIPIDSKSCKHCEWHNYESWGYSREKCDLFPEEEYIKEEGRLQTCKEAAQIECDRRNK